MAHAFDSLSIEINQLIGAKLDNDRDLASYRLICRSTNAAIDHDNGSFWRTRFLSTFDPPLIIPSHDRRKTNGYYRDEYQSRQRILRKGVLIQSGTSEIEKQYLLVIKKLICESFNSEYGKADKTPAQSKNMMRIKKVVNANGLLDAVLRPVWYKRRKIAPSPLLLTIQLTLTHISLTASSNSRAANVWSFPECQTMAYMSESKQPIFKGPNNMQVDVEWALHVASFFRQYLLGQQELTAQYYQALDVTERPQGWRQKLCTTSQRLGKHWKGSYAYVDHREILHIRSGRHEDRPVLDHLNGENDKDGFQTLRLEFPQGGNEVWPEVFEGILKSRSKIQYKTAITRAQRRTLGPDVAPPGEPVSFRFEGEGEDSSDVFLAAGWLNPLPNQNGISGWQRMTMMKYWTHADGTMDMESLWAYEGVVLPGGMIMVGRWWHPWHDGDEDEYSGPFILWNVDASMPTQV